MMDLPSVINLLYNSGTRCLTDQMPSRHHINEQQHWLTVSHSDRCSSVTALLQGTKLHQRRVGFEPPCLDLFRHHIEAARKSQSRRIELRVIPDAYSEH